MEVNISYDFLSSTDNSVYYNYNNCCVIVIDVLRASTTINTLLELHKKVYITEVENIDNIQYKDKFIKFGEKNDPLDMYLSDIYTISVNLAGLPAISIPVNWFNGLPVGLQLIGKGFDELSILKVAYGLEKSLNS